MSGVKRFNIGNFHSAIVSAGAECVLASDYDTLRNELENMRISWGLLRSERDTLRTANQRLEGEVRRLREALDEAAQDIAEWGAYASDYFQEKHDLDGCIAKYAALAGDGGDA